MDSLVEVKQTEINQLLLELQADLPVSVHAYNYLKIALEWKEKKPQYNVKVLAPFGDSSDTTFILQTSVRECFCGTAYSRGINGGLDRLKSGVERTSRIDWGGSWAFTCMEPYRGGKVIESVARAKMSDEDLVIHNNKVFHLLQEEANILLKNLRPIANSKYNLVGVGEQEFDIINGNWSHKTPLLETLVMDSLELNGGWGLLDMADDTLVSWAVTTFYRGIGLVQTLPQSRGKGLASRVVLELASRMKTPHLHLSVQQGNHEAEKFFCNLKFKPLNQRFLWVYSKFFG